MDIRWCGYSAARVRGLDTAPGVMKAIPTAISLSELSRRVNLPIPRVAAAIRCGIIHPDLHGPNHQILFLEKNIEDLRYAVRTAGREQGKVAR